VHLLAVIFATYSAFPQSTASTIYGMYDLFKGVGRDWGFLTEGNPGPELVAPQIVSAHSGSFTAANGVALTPHGHLDARPAPQVVCVPDIFVAPGESLTQDFAAELRYLRRVYHRGPL
jgi:hypothetical protein